ncbi:ACBP-domain-containing protein [Trametes versicolor FP-101664 SS1]|uniref:ACBP-domain-containing protein n=1 Tax=Trametes versicolor (strain FP-101664) TaxID=717944 RepID=UPI00046223D3|nr:ACBP-domain-containing protein [Trametes versicolor FP-101664 SS1]EIW61778.1 ACBP-domain-containing protein [Trametes versicolor FP-101664 SS1]
MDSRQLIDAQFDRAVEIVQSLPKTGPIQTAYEDKLNILYKQATVGNVQGPRPSVWDMLGRAKWDAWAKHKDLDSYEAKWLYVDALLKVLRKYPDKTVARDLVRELESYNGDPSNLVMSGISSRPPASASSGSSASGEIPPISQRPSEYMSAQARVNQPPPPPGDPGVLDSETDESTSDEEDEAADVVPPAITSPLQVPGQLNRPQSSLSSRRYRTPMAGSLLIPSSPPMNVPATQPHPGFQTQSAFGESAASLPSSAYPTTSVSYPEQIPHSSSVDPQDFVRGGYRPPSQPQYRTYGGSTVPPPRPASLPLLERAVESVQVHLAAITERLETLESLLHHSTASLSPAGPGPRSPGLLAGRGSPSGGGARGGGVRWDVDDMGMWTLVLHPLARALRLFKQLAAFLANGEGRSPTFVVVRRLFLDISFVLCFLALVKAGWRRSGVRRKEVVAALRGLWRAILGQQGRRHMVERGV